MMLVLSSPSGAGKSTLSRLLIERDRGGVELSVSATTRNPRVGEIDGVHYHFVTRESFNASVAAGAFLEHARVFDHFYGTLRTPVEAALGAGRDVLFDVDWQGARQLHAAAQGDVVRVFVLPPSLTALRARLKARAQDPDDVIERRMGKAIDEIAHWDEYDYVLINDRLEETYEALRAILSAERLKRLRQPGLERVVQELTARA
jgi:guanylate kinase